MAPKKRKNADAADTQRSQTLEAEHLLVLNKRLQEIDAAVEERCEAIKAAADEAVTKIMQQLKVQLLQLPKKVRAQPYHEYAAGQQHSSTGVPDAATALVDSKLEAAQQQSVAAATAAPTTRSLRSRARAAVTAATLAAEPRTTRSQRSRLAVAAAEEGDGDPLAAPPAQTILESKPAAGQAQLQTLMGIDSPAQPASPPAVAAAAADPVLQPAAAADARRAAAVDRAQAKVDAKLAALGLAAAAGGAGGVGRTVQRAARPGEACFSKNGSPLSIHPNVTRTRGRAIAAPLMTPALQAAAAGSSMVGCVTLIKKQAPATGAAAATGRSKRSRMAAAAATGEQAAGGGCDNTAMMITTEDGSTFTVDAAAGGVEAVPAPYRDEVTAKLRALQQLATAALGRKA